MFTDAQRAIVSATVPILRTGGETLTKHFYKTMFRDFPEVKVFFNQAHQASGAQPRALANSILAYAENIYDLQKLDPRLVQQIINKHVALQVKAEHYPIVGQCLLRAIREVLGPETATDEVIAAWGAAYGQLADILIGAEGKVYQQIAETKGGWAGARRFVVSKKVKESDVIVSLYLTPEDGKEVIAYEPGQYIGLQLYVPAEGAADNKAAAQEIRRNYSLSQAADGKSLRISVKREPKGVASSLLHDGVKEGDVLNVFPPVGQFVLSKQPKRHTVLLSAGVGITPTLAMLQHLSKSAPATAAAEPAVTFVHFARNPEAHAFAKDVERISGESNGYVKHHFFYTEEQQCGSANEERAVELVQSCLPASAAADADVYLLGPKGFMRAMRKGLMVHGVPAEQIHYEFFGPAASIE